MPYVPSDCIANGKAGGSVPHHCRLTLISDANSLDVLDVVAIVQKNVCSPVDALFYGVNNFPWIVFMPSVPIREKFWFWYRYLLTLTEDTFG